MNFYGNNENSGEKTAQAHPWVTGMRQTEMSLLLELIICFIASPTRTHTDSKNKNKGYKIT